MSRHIYQNLTPCMKESLKEKIMNPVKNEQMYEGKAKILYSTNDPKLLIQYFKDDATAFNAAKKGTIAQKGIVNNKISAKIFEYLSSKGIKTHFVSLLNDREMLVRR